MKKAAWKNRIKKSCEAAGTYRPCFDDTISTLADVLEQRDKTYASYKEHGAEPTIQYTNKGGQTNWVKNPELQVWDDLNKSALAYWRDLGLTPAGLKKIDEQAMKPKKVSALAAALKDLG